LILKDIQKTKPKRNLKIQRVGITNVPYPIIVKDRVNGTQHTIGLITMSVDLPKHYKGTHMSRFIEILNEHSTQININQIGIILEKLREKFDAKSAHLEVAFPYFITKNAPVSSVSGLMEYECKLMGTIDRKKDFIVEVRVPVTTLCPCSKAISKKGAHSQRCIVKIRVRYKHFFWIEDLIQIAESSASCDIYPILKRRDEKYVTEKAYNRPRFVEDLVREIAWKLKQDKNFFYFSVEAESMESIHNYNVYAFIEEGKDNE